MVPCVSLRVDHCPVLHKAQIGLPLCATAPLDVLVVVDVLAGDHPKVPVRLMPYPESQNSHCVLFWCRMELTPSSAIDLPAGQAEQRAFSSVLSLMSLTAVR